MNCVCGVGAALLSISINNFVFIVIIKAIIIIIK